MSSILLQINFKFNVARADYEGAVAPLASEYASLAGLRWKIWLMNESESESGGIMMFEDEASAEAYLSGPLAATVTGHPALSDFSVKKFEIMERETAATRGPVA
jgi:hypothetical protein